MAKSKLVEANKKMEEKVVGSYKKVENAVVGNYTKMQDAVVGGYKKIEDKFVDQYLTKEGESVAEAKERLNRESTMRKAKLEEKKCGCNHGQGERKRGDMYEEK